MQVLKFKCYISLPLAIKNIKDCVMLFKTKVNRINGIYNTIAVDGLNNNSL